MPRSVGNSLDFSAPVFSCSVSFADLVVLQAEDAEVPSHAFFIAFLHISAFLDGGNGGRVGRRAADAQLFELFHQGWPPCSGRGAAEALGGFHFLHFQHLLHRERGQYAFLFFVAFIFIVAAFHVYFQEAVELQHFAAGGQLLVVGGDPDLGDGLFQFRIRHLAGDGAFPDQFVQAFEVRIVYRRVLHISRADGLMRFLRVFVLILVFTALVSTVRRNCVLIALLMSAIAVSDRFTESVRM